MAAARRRARRPAGRHPRPSETAPPLPAPVHPLRFLGPLFLVSGAAALVVETTWLRWLRDLLGATAPAASATLVAFFAGQAAGAVWGSRVARRAADADGALRRYAALEAGAAAGALAVPGLLAVGTGLLDGVYDALVDAPALLTVLRFAVALVCTAPAAVCQGAALPAIAAAGLAGPAALGGRGSALYGLHTAGAALGAAAAAFGLPRWLGVPATYGLGVGLSLAAAGAALARARWRSAGAARDPGATDAPAAPPRDRSAGAEPPTGAGREAVSPARRWLGLAALSGFGSFAAQVLWVQAFGQVLDQSVHAFGAVLVAVLAGLALGAAFVAWAVGRQAMPARGLLGLALSVAALGLLGFPAALFAATDGLSYLGGAGTWPVRAGRVVGVVALTAGPALLAAAMVLPAVFALAGEEGGARGGGGGAGARLGRLAAANTAGAVAGALAGPFVLAPLFGLWGAFLALSLLYAVPAVFLRDVAASTRTARDVFLAGGWVALVVLASPLELPLTRLAPGEELLAERTTASGLVAVVERRGERLIRVDNHYALGGTSERVHEERQGHLPLVLHGDPQTALFVGTATGITAGAGLLHPLERLRLVEIVPAVVGAAREHFADANRGVYDAARSRVVLDDARNHLRLTDARFDVVMGDLFVPWRSGTGVLYTREHFASVRERLAPGGLFCQWLPLYQLSEREFAILAATFADVFPTSALFRNDFFGLFPVAALVGWRDAPADAGRIAAAARRLGGTELPEERWATHPVGVWALYAGPLGPAEPGAPRNTTAHPRLEFLAAEGHAGGGRGKLDPLVGLDWARIEARAALRRRGGDRLFPGLPPEARRAADAGLALRTAGAFYAEGLEAQARQAWARAVEGLPPELLSPDTPDPSAAELWIE